MILYWQMALSRLIDQHRKEAKNPEIEEVVASMDVCELELQQLAQESVGASEARCQISIATTSDPVLVKEIDRLQNEWNDADKKDPNLRHYTLRPDSICLIKNFLVLNGRVIRQSMKGNFKAATSSSFWYLAYEGTYEDASGRRRWAILKKLSKLVITVSWHVIGLLKLLRNLGLIPRGLGNEFIWILVKQTKETLFWSPPTATQNIWMLSGLSPLLLIQSCNTCCNFTGNLVLLRPLLRITDDSGFRPN